MTEHRDRSPSVVIRDLTKSFPRRRSVREILSRKRRGERICALESLTLEMHPGEVVGLLGPNGSGKTTLIKSLVNLIEPDAGSIRIGSIDARRKPELARRDIGWVHCDERSFLWRLSGFENLKFFAALLEVPEDRATDLIRKYLDYFGLTSKRHDRFGTYSAGQRKAFAIIRAFLNEPSVLLMDEPTNALDPIVSRKLKEHVRDHFVGRRDCSVLWATHRLEEVREICDRAAVIRRGSLLFLGTPDELEQLAPEAGTERDSDGGSPLAKVVEHLLTRTS